MSEQRDTWLAHYIHGGGADHVVVEHNKRFVTALVVDEEVLRDFLSPEPFWDNWHGDDDEPVGDYEHFYGGRVIATRRDNEAPMVYEHEHWEERLRFFGLKPRA